jgi:hypothetical protein
MSEPKNILGNEASTAVTNSASSALSSNLAADNAQAGLAIPDRLSVDPKSPFFNSAILEKDVCIRLNGYERNDVNEYCISEGWVVVDSAKARDRKGRPLQLKLKGKVEAWTRA